MNYLKIILSSFVLLLLCSSACKESVKKTQKVVAKQTVNKDTETSKLIKYYEEMGDYVNSRQFPSLIKAASVFEQMDGNIHIIDLRNPDYFAKGHIKNAVNITFKDILKHFENDIVPFEYDKIILVCYAGQYASYTTSLLRLMGYGNVYAMRWGMSAWNKEFAKDFWIKSVSDKYEGKLETHINEHGPAGELPKLSTGKTEGEEINTEITHQLFNKEIDNAFISADDVFSNPENYYIINYDRKDKYEAGHIPGAVRYKPGGTLGIITEMQTIPADKNVVVYCGTGHNSAFATAYLQLLGYKAQTLIYGNNSFMYNKMTKEKTTLSWLPFSEDEIKNYPFIKD